MIIVGRNDRRIVRLVAKKMGDYRMARFVEGGRLSSRFRPTHAHLPQSSLVAPGSCPPRPAAHIPKLPRRFDELALASLLPFDWLCFVAQVVDRAGRQLGGLSRGARTSWGL